MQAAAGRFVDGRVPLLTIVPGGAAMRAELFAPSRAIGFVQPGQEVRVMYDAFPYQRFCSFAGRVEQVSRVIIAPGEVDAPVKIGVPPKAFERYASRPATASVQAREADRSRRAYEALLSGVPADSIPKLDAILIVDPQTGLKPLAAITLRRWRDGSMSEPR